MRRGRGRVKREGGTERKKRERMPSLFFFLRPLFFFPLSVSLTASGLASFLPPIAQGRG